MVVGEAKGPQRVSGRLPHTNEGSAMTGRHGRDELAEMVAGLADRYRVSSGEGFRLADHDPAEIHPTALTKPTAAKLLHHGVLRLSRLQEKLYAEKKTAVLVVLQAMDTAGKDSTIKHVMSGVNPQGVSVTAFKAPSAEELGHDFLWRVSRALPAQGTIGIFNRSHYEDVLVTRVHPDLLGGAPPAAGGRKLWEQRFQDIAAFERHLTREGTRIVKVFLHLSRDEQKKRLLARLDDPAKAWKFEAGDLKERDLWPAYMRAYQAAIAGTARKRAPWFVVPADHKWFARLVVVEIINATLRELHMEPLRPDKEQTATFAEARRRLEKSK